MVNLARRMALERERRVARVHPRAVVADADQRDAAPFDLDLDARRAGVDGVLDELLDDARRSLDDLARGDLVREIGRQRVDAPHRP